MKYFQEEMECASREKIQAIQDEKIVKQVKHAYDNIPYYRSLMEQKGVSPEDVHGIKDLYKLPFLSKSDLRDQYPDGLLAVDKKDVVRIQSTSGTTGKRVIAYYTANDLELWSDCTARAIVAVGGNEEDVVQIAYGYGLFTGGMGLHDGARKVGCMTLPMSSGNTERQIQFMHDLKSTILCCTPSYAAYLGEALKEYGLTKKDINLKAGIFGAEPWTESMRKDIENSLGIKAYDIFGLTELSGPGVSYECSEQAGMHLNEDHFYAEIINPETGEVLPYGQKGELVLTSLDKEAFPLIRYRTRDISRLFYEKCKCGRTTVRMENLSGRTDDMLKIRGVNVFPSQIEEALIGIEGIGPNYEIVVEKNGSSDLLTIRVELDPDKMQDSVAFISGLEKKIRDEIKFILGLDAKIQIENPNTLQRFEGKAKRVKDLRPKEA